VANCSPATPETKMNGTPGNRRFEFALAARSHDLDRHADLAQLMLDQLGVDMTVFQEKNADLRGADDVGKELVQVNGLRDRAR
jgi:hypothetical protein